MKQRPHRLSSQTNLNASGYLLAIGLHLAGCGNDGGNAGVANNTDVMSAPTTSDASAVTSSPTPSMSTGSQPSSNVSTSAPTGATPTSPPTPSTSTAPTTTRDSEAAGSEGEFTSSNANDDGTSQPLPSSEPTFDTTEPLAPEDPKTYAAGFHELYLHDECTDDNPADDVCAHERVHEVTFAFGGDVTTTYDVRLRIRGLFEPTNVSGGETPDPAHPYFKVNGNVEKADYSQWQIVVAEPAATYYLNHYPAVGHTIYKEDFEATIQVRGAAEVKVRVEDANDRQIDNGYVGNPDRQQLIEGVTPEVVNGQVLRLDVVDVTAAK